MRRDIVAVIPAFQCCPTIGEVVEATRRFIDRVVVVDDGSSDGSGEAARAAGAEVYRIENNSGKGVALRHGWERVLPAEGVEALALIDGDGQHDPLDLPTFFKAWDEGNVDLLVGARLKNRTDIPVHRYWTNIIGSKLLTWVSGVDLEDSQSGYRLISVDLLNRIGLRSKGYAIESEMLLKSAKRGARIAHVPIRTIYHDRVPSHFRPLVDTTRIFCASVYHRIFDAGR